MKTKNILLSVAALAILSLTSCGDDFLNRNPKSALTPENYFNQESDLTSYVLDLFNNNEVFYTETNYLTKDGDTDDLSGINNANDMYVPGRWKVPQTGGSWDFSVIRKINYFLQTVLPKYNAGRISGDINQIKHDLGEAYMVRASIYFTRLKQLGDFPIIREAFPDDEAILKAASKRAPQNEVARFIISDLDSAILLLQTKAPDVARNRLSKPCAQLLKSRVALYEGTWLKYFKGTAFVPGGPGWPGAAMDYNKNFSYASGSIDDEIKYFLSQAMVSAQAVADITPLETNNMGIQQSISDPVNKYFNMYGEVDLSSHAEILFWKRYDLTLNVTNGVAMEAGKGNSGNGLTRGFIDSYLMANGLPIYDPASGYQGDDSIQALRKNRDNRLQIFVKVPGQLNILLFNPAGDHSVRVEPYPAILSQLGNDRYTTGYANRKGLSYDEAQYGNFLGYTGEVIFRGAEAYLNYIEASYELNGSIDATADKYWRAIRTRAGVNPDYNKTIAATDVSKEAPNDWGAYSAGNLIDATLYNIRRERRCELEVEGFRKADLHRWRAMDQMILANGGTPYQIEGFKLWGPLQKWYIDPKTKKTLLKYNKGTSSNVSDPALSIYLRPHQLVKSNIGYNGYTWCMAHYLEPIAVEHFLQTSDDYTDPLKSPIYQNPGWPTSANTAPIGF